MNYKRFSLYMIVTTFAIFAVVLALEAMGISIGNASMSMLPGCAGAMAEGQGFAKQHARRPAPKEAWSFGLRAFPLVLALQFCAALVFAMFAPGLFAGLSGPDLALAAGLSAVILFVLMVPIMRAVFAMSAKSTLRAMERGKT
ncbi:hypothetical protein ERN12_08140 [Rhodobacteraceae bacterium]|nr:hypothetical protein ERN12_08140 [Paracoccaceae bacterium]